jgi:clan AA aspartic protease (TIGR02281 family)
MIVQNSPITAARLVSFLLGVSICASQLAMAQVVEAPRTNSAYSDEVVAKADKFLADAGLKRSGKTIFAVGIGELNRVLTSLSKSRKAIKQLADARKQTEAQLARTQQQFQLLDAQNGELNLRLARPGLDAGTNNQLVGLINANNSQLRQLNDLRTQLREKLAADRRAVNEAEAKYAEMVLALRRDFTALQTELEPLLNDEKVQIALKVSSANFQTPEKVDIATLLGATDRRIKQIEKEIFSESIPVEVTPSGGLYVQVVVGDQSVPMVLDSGASLISLPAETAAKLGITVPANAARMQLVLADGRTIGAHRVVLPSVRVGQFEAKDVEAAVLEPVAVNAEPLLGMSYLGNFRFEIDTAGRSLKMLRVGDES